mgnify:CR=1 FL=1
MQRFFASFVSGVRQAYDKLFPNVLKKRTWWPVFLVGIFLISIVSVTLVFAAIDFTTVFGWVGRILASILLELAKLCIFLAIFFLRFFITLASYNNYIDVSVVRLGWVMVRDVANMFFIVGLLVIAFATILGLEGYEWKRGLVKIVLMAILINFSNLIAQLVIDVAHIFTITFLNPVSATAGGNLINLFQFDKILGLVSGDALGTTPENASLALFAASVMSFLFALLAAVTIGAYLVTMIARIVVLWALIILSPLAFMLYALPKGEDYAREWWSEFTKHVIVAPIMVFFLWLAFATFGTGQIISEIQSGPNVIKIDATGENAQFQQSVSILEITTWENMASFLLGIAFLWVGIKKTQDTGATGSGLIGGAVDFTKKVATIATGYAAGRWLVGKGVEVGGAYGKLAASKTGLLAVKDYFGREKLRRDAALKKVDYLRDMKARAVTAKGGGFAGLFAPDAKTRAMATEKTEMIEKQKETAFNRQRIDARVQISGEQRQKFDKNLENILIKNIDPKEAEKIKNISDPELRLEELSKKFNVDKLREFQEQAAESTPFVATHLDQMSFKEIENKLKGDEDKFFGIMNLGYVMKETREFEEALEKANEELVQNTVLELVAIQKLSQQLGKTENEIRKGNYQDQIQAKKKEIKEMDYGYDYEKKEFKTKYAQKNFEKFINDNREEAIKNIDEKQRVNVMADVIANNPQWLKIQAQTSIKSAEQKTKKAESEEKNIGLKISDILRGLQGKEMDEIRNMERAKISEELKELEGISYEEIFELFQRNLKDIRELTDKQKNGETLSDQEKDFLKNRSQSQARVVASIQQRGYHHSMVGALRSFNQSIGDTSYDEIIDDEDGAGKLLLGALTARSATELKTPEDASRVQEEYRKNLKEKAGILFRTIQKGVQDSAEQKGNIHLFHQFAEGRNEFGAKVVGAAVAMKNGVGTKGVLGTGKKEDGVQMIKSDVKDYMEPNFDILSAADGREYTNITASGVTIKQRAKGQIATIARIRSADGIKKMGTPKLRYLLGAREYGESGLYDETSNSFHKVPPDFKEEWKPVFSEWKKISDPQNQDESPAVKANVLSAWKELYTQFGFPPEKIGALSHRELVDIARKSGML